jgi:DNA-binding PadR family transcriptional regulator
MRERSTGHVILGILAVGGDLSGYDIRQWIGRAIGFFWSESFGQIYPELQRLAKAKLIKALPSEGKGREVKRYRITQSGRTALARWLAQAPQAERPRNELLLKLFFGPVTGEGSARAFLEEAGRVQEQRVAALQAAEDLVMAEEKDSDNLAYWLITILHGQFLCMARREWVQVSLALLQARAEGGNAAVLRTHAKAKKRIMGV